MGVYYSRIKIFNNFSHEIKDLANETIQFSNALKRFPPINSFYNSEEYLHFLWLFSLNWYKFKLILLVLDVYGLCY
jgi:hypothetical protein